MIGRVLALALVLAGVAAAQQCPQGYTLTGGICVANSTGVVGTVPSVLLAQTFAGADPSIQINACLTAVAAAGGGTCDARGYPNSTVTLTQGIVVPAKVILLLPVATWNFSINNSAACGIMQRDGSTVTGPNPGGTYLGLLIGALNSSVNMDSLWCSEPSPTEGGSYIVASGFALINYGGGTFANGVCHLQNLFDQSWAHDIVCVNPYGLVSRVSNVCCNSTIERLNFYGSSTGTGGGDVLDIDSGVNFDLKDITTNGPTAGHYAVNLTGVGFTKGVNITNYSEKYGSDVTTPLFNVAANVAEVHFVGGAAVLSNCSGSCTQPLFQTNQYYNGFTVENYSPDSRSNVCVKDIQQNLTWYSDTNTCNYRKGSSPSFYPGPATTATTGSQVQVLGAGQVQPFTLVTPGQFVTVEFSVTLTSAGGDGILQFNGNNISGNVGSAVGIYTTTCTVYATGTNTQTANCATIAPSGTTVAPVSTALTGASSGNWPVALYAYQSVASSVTANYLRIRPGAQ